MSGRYLPQAGRGFFIHFVVNTIRIPKTKKIISNNDSVNNVCLLRFSELWKSVREMDKVTIPSRDKSVLGLGRKILQRLREKPLDH